MVRNGCGKKQKNSGKRRKQYAVSAGLAAIGFSAACRAQTPGFYLVGETAGANESSVHDISYDGSLAVGYTGRSSGTSVERAYRWSVETGRVDATDPGLLPFNSFTGLSSDGMVVAGYMYPLSGGANLQSFVRYPGQPLTILPLLPGYSRAYYPTRVSGNGMVLAGMCRGTGTPPPIRCFRWTATGGIQAIPYARAGDTLALVHDISSDGTTIVGSSASPAGGTRVPFKWRAQTGTIVLPTPTASAEAYGVSADGSIVVGRYDNPGEGTRAVYWDSQSQMHDLGSIAGSTTHSAECISDDGRIIGGSAGFEIGTTWQGFVWTVDAGMRPAADYFAERGAPLPPDHEAVICNAVSGNGRVFGVRYRRPGQAANVSAIAVLGVPCPADFNRDGGVDGSDVKAFFDPWASGLPIADVNEDGGVDGEDVAYFFAAWETSTC